MELELQRLRVGESFEALLTGRIGVVMKQCHSRNPPGTIAYFEDGHPRMLCGLVRVRRLDDLPKLPVGRLWEEEAKLK